MKRQTHEDHDGSDVEEVSGGVDGGEAWFDVVNPLEEADDPGSTDLHFALWQMAPVSVGKLGGGEREPELMNDDTNSPRRVEFFLAIAAALVGLLVEYGFSQIDGVVLRYSSKTAAVVRNNIGVIAWESVCVLVMLAVGAMFYTMRCRLQRAYGLLEIMVGTATAAYVATEFDQTQLTFNNIFALLAALYVIVRGFDNIYRSIPEGPKIKSWNQLFFGRASESKL
jgi:hypothetical protein